VTEAPTSPTLTAGLTRYPYYATAEAYLKNFLGRGRRHYIKTRRYALYRYSRTLDIMVIRLAPHIYEVRAYPPGALNVASLEEGLAIEALRGWIFVNDPRTRKSVLIASTQKVGLELYRLARFSIRHKGTLARADFYYRRLV